MTWAVLLALDLDHNQIGVMELATLGLFLLAATTLWIQQNNAKRERQENHVENSGKLNALLDFQRSQIEVNSKRDIQVGELQRQSATMAEMARGMDRRLQMIEDSHNHRTTN